MHTREIPGQLDIFTCNGVDWHTSEMLLSALRIHAFMPRRVFTFVDVSARKLLKFTYANRVSASGNGGGKRAGNMERWAINITIPKRGDGNGITCWQHALKLAIAPCAAITGDSERVSDP